MMAGVERAIRGEAITGTGGKARVQVPQSSVAAVVQLSKSLLVLAGADRLGAEVLAPDTSSARPGTVFYRPGPDAGSKQERVRAAFAGASASRKPETNSEATAVVSADPDPDADSDSELEPITEDTVLPEDMFHQRDPYSMHLLR